MVAYSTQGSWQSLFFGVFLQKPDAVDTSIVAYVRYYLAQAPLGVYMCVFWTRGFLYAITIMNKI